jgi:prephenate dehydrogenase
MEVIQILTGMILKNKMLINIAGGRGPMGQTHKPVFEAAGHEVIISGRKTKPGLEEAAAIADLTIITVPISCTNEVIHLLAPYSKALVDFTGVKIHPINAMLNYSNESCEVGGLHPLYGLRNSIKNETIIYCPTYRSGEKCNKIISALEKAGAKILIMTPEKHDKFMDLTQNQRIIMLKKYIAQLKESQLSIQEVYDVSPVPTRIILDLLARQVDEKNGSMYEEMIEYNHFTSKRGLHSLMTPAEIRNFFGDLLRPAQGRAKKYIESSRE